jgi:uncharacterized membrane protein YgcG
VCIPTPPPQLPAVRGMQQAEEFDNQRPMPGRKNTQKVKLLVDPDEYFLRTKKRMDLFPTYRGGGGGSGGSGGGGSGVGFSGAPGEQGQSGGG